MERVDKIADLKPYSKGVNLVAKVVSKSEPKTVGSQYDQSQHQLVNALIADETGAVSLVLWDENISKVNEGDTVRISNAFIKLFRGRMQLNLGRYGRIEKSDEEIGEVNTENNVSERVETHGGYRGYGGGSGYRRDRSAFQRSE